MSTTSYGVRSAKSAPATEARTTFVRFLKGVRRDLFEAKKSASNAGWWSDVQDGWRAEEVNHRRLSDRLLPE